MRLLQNIHRLDFALENACQRLTHAGTTRTVPLSASVGLMSAVDIKASAPTPHFARSTMDGYAVMARDTAGASEAIPAMLTMGANCQPVLTGGLLPDGYDAVVMLEYAEELADGTLLAYRAVALGENVIAVGEDVQAGVTVIEEGEIITSRKLALLAALGHFAIAVKCLTVAVFSTGDEIVKIEDTPDPGKVRDINGHYLTAFFRDWGFDASYHGIIPDTEELLRQHLSKALETFDAIVLSGGSSAGAYDHTRSVLAQLGSPGVLTHGIALKPGKPTLIAAVEGKLIVGLPGHPLSCAVTAKYVALPLLRYVVQASLRDTVEAHFPLNRAVPSVAGRRDIIPVAIHQGQAQPLLSKSAAISALTYSDGLLVIEEECEGLPAGSLVKVDLWGVTK